MTGNVPLLHTRERVWTLYFNPAKLMRSNQIRQSWSHNFLGLRNQPYAKRVIMLCREHRRLTMAPSAMTFVERSDTTPFQGYSFPLETANFGRPAKNAWVTVSVCIGGSIIREEPARLKFENANCSRLFVSQDLLDLCVGGVWTSWAWMSTPSSEKLHFIMHFVAVSLIRHSHTHSPAHAHGLTFMFVPPSGSPRPQLRRHRGGNRSEDEWSSHV